MLAILSFHDILKLKSYICVLDDCLGVSCGHGYCMDSINSYKCVCQAGFTGAHCHTDINECEVHPCQNGGTCQDMTAEYHCSCTKQYEGKHCEIKKDGHGSGKFKGNNGFKSKGKGRHKP